MAQANNNRKSAQILLIFIIALAILSIFVVVIAINVRRDRVETTQNDQYEAFYSLSEEKILEFIAGEIANDGECQPQTNPTTTGTNYACTIAYEGTTLNVNLTETITSDFENYPLEKDKSLKISLDDGTDTGYQGAIYFSYTGTADWNITIDYIDQKGLYTVNKIVYKDQTNSIYVGTPDNPCIFSNSGTVITFSIGECLNAVGGGQALALRMKPIMATNGTVNLSLYGDSGLPGQMRVIESVSNVGQLSAESGSIPRIVLQIMQPIHESPIEILDYVLRSDTDVDK